MYYAPVTDSYYPLPVTYVPVYPTLIERRTPEYVPRRSNDDLSRVQKELEDLREELNDLRLEKSSCSICSSTSRASRAAEDCSICSSRYRISPVQETYSRPPSPVHYCSICDDYVIDSPYPPPPPSPRVSISSPRLYRAAPKRVSDDRSSEYLSRQVDLQGLRHRYVPETRPVWIPTAYKHGYPHRRWATRHSRFSEP